MKVNKESEQIRPPSLSESPDTTGIHGNIRHCQHRIALTTTDTSRTSKQMAPPLVTPQGVLATLSNPTTACPPRVIRSEDEGLKSEKMAALLGRHETVAHAGEHRLRADTKTVMRTESVLEPPSPAPSLSAMKLTRVQEEPRWHARLV